MEQPGACRSYWHRSASPSLPPPAIGSVVRNTGISYRISEHAVLDCATFRAGANDSGGYTPCPRCSKSCAAPCAVPSVRTYATSAITTWTSLPALPVRRYRSRAESAGTGSRITPPAQTQAPRTRNNSQELERSGTNGVSLCPFSLSSLRRASSGRKSFRMGLFHVGNAVPDNLP